MRVLLVSCLSCLYSSGHLYVTCLIQNCSDKLVTAQFLGTVDRGSLLVQDDYVFVKVTTVTSHGALQSGAFRTSGLTGGPGD